MKETVPSYTCLTGNGTGWQRDAVWGILTLFSQGKIDPVDLRIIECVTVQGLSIRAASRFVNTPLATTFRRLQKMKRLFADIL